MHRNGIIKGNDQGKLLQDAPYEMGQMNRI